MDHLGMNDANSDPMSDLFTKDPDLTPYAAVLPGSLCEPPVNLDLIPECHQTSIPRTSSLKSLHDGKWWANATRNFNFKRPDDLDSAAFNRVLWRGVMGEKPYPVDRRSGADAE
jgi:DNA-binding beta-propeller fold protein YncE